MGGWAWGWSWGWGLGLVWQNEWRPAASACLRFGGRCGGRQPVVPAGAESLVLLGTGAVKSSCCSGLPWAAVGPSPTQRPHPLPQVITATKAAGRRLAQARPADELTHMMVPEENPRDHWDCESVLSIRWGGCFLGLLPAGGVVQLLPPGAAGGAAAAACGRRQLGVQLLPPGPLPAR
jgi:hypothetical protein